jgi:hypothetical protein
VYPFQEFIPDRRWWENYSEQFRAADALWRIGELAFFVDMWKTDDFNAGFVTRCTTCQNNIEPYVSQVYEQSAFDRCPTCFGVMYAGRHGGVRALAVLPSMWQFGEKDLQWLPRGEVETQTAQVVAPGSFRLFKRDYIFRGDGNRFSVNSVQALHLSSGFGTTAHTESAITNTYSVALENPSSPAYLIPPPQSVLLSLLATDNQRYVPDFSGWIFNDSPTPTGV